MARWYGHLLSAAVARVRNISRAQPFVWLKFRVVESGNLCCCVCTVVHRSGITPSVEPGFGTRGSNRHAYWNRTVHGTAMVFIGDGRFRCDFYFATHLSGS